LGAFPGRVSAVASDRFRIAGVEDSRSARLGNRIHAEESDQTGDHGAHAEVVKTFHGISLGCIAASAWGWVGLLGVVVFNGQE
jgi:hypothetical protein